MADGLVTKCKPSKYRKYLGQCDVREYQGTKCNQEKSSQSTVRTKVKHSNPRFAQNPAN